MPSPKSAAGGGSSSQQQTPSEGAKNLQERLHQLLTRLSSTIELIKTWPSTDGDDASIHVETTTRLISLQPKTMLPSMNIPACLIRFTGHL